MPTWMDRKSRFIEFPQILLRFKHMQYPQKDEVWRTQVDAHKNPHVH